MNVAAAIERLVVIPDYDAGDGPRPCVHTFRVAAFGPIGAHWSVEKARQAMETEGVEEATDPMMLALGHPLVVDVRGPVFFEARDA